MEGIRHERKRARVYARYKLDEEEGRVEPDHDGDTCRLGPRHLCGFESSETPGKVFEVGV